MSYAEFDADVVIDARNCILGRTASQIAELALDGERVAVINAEGAVITGSEEDVMSVYRKRDAVGSDRGPHYPRRPDRLFKRAVRGMLPYKTTRGREAFENVRIYLGNPYDDGDIEPTVLDGTSLDRLSNIKFISLGEIGEKLGANVTW
ncbi:MAG: 50S ribosomal protein L13 [Natronomonas sp.]|jgi:large subunit ribosomal protein L13|uniref:Large ribosomal subunit protein uL13 n=1 Tax=Natronomonas salsuginis TaxID=2217661 RepID=A0A4U5JF11_9EURY|nr:MULTISPECIES: 50S ribosomal protein L13 [Natronomonas]MDR9380611.1 50S ribosomal protein L13 [Natronomonas sp.]MDR9429130.1 50S ribosomal protein L13 [Natronomonas sp.]TKR27754.1 50S ribosomal protein L13 [Natronomonas salsuginis]